MQVSDTQELSKGMPQVRFKLPASVSGDGGKRAKTSDPSGDECSRHCLCSDVCDGYCLRPGPHMSTQRSSHLREGGVLPSLCGPG